MSELSDAQKAEMHAALLALRSQIEARLAAVTVQAKPVQLSDPIGRLSRMDALQAQQMATAQRKRDEGRLQQIGAALSRLTAGEGYGTCLRCEEPIGFERLRVAPDATLCLRCRSETER